MNLLLVVLAVTAAAVAGWQACVALRVERLLDELDQAVSDNAILMAQQVARRRCLVRPTRDPGMGP